MAIESRSGSEYMERVTDRDLDELRRLAIQMGALAEAILAKALRAAWDGNEVLAREVRSDDLEIDRLDIEIDEAILRLLALRAPVARDLRLVLATKSLATDLERVGDLSRNVAECATRWAEHPRSGFPPVLRKLADDSRRMLRNALESYASLDAQLARRVIADDDRVDGAERAVLAESMKWIHDHPEEAEQAVNCIFIASSLERVGDHATNIAEDVVLATDALNLKHAGKLGGVEGR
jgi:phosphate transport system protein